jgi:hypothetical protein
MQRTAAFLLFLLLLASPARALDMAAKPPADGQRLEAGRLYLVHYRCSRPVVQNSEYDLDNYLSRVTSLYRQGRNPFARVTAVAHGVIIAKRNAGLTEAKLDLPLKAESFPEAPGGFPIHVYSVVNGNGSITKADNRRCDGYLVVSGNDEFEVRPLFRYSLNATDNIVAKTASLLLTSISPAVSLISGKPLAAAALDQIHAAGDLVANYKSYMELFREDGSESETLPLRTGVTRIGTFASRLEINVRPIDSLLTDCEDHKGEGCVNFPNALDQLTRGRSLIAGEGDIAEQCVRFEQTVRRSGISNDIDIAYVLYQAAVENFVDRRRIIACLRPHLAENAVANARFYANLTEEQKLRAEDIAAFVRNQDEAAETERLAKSQPMIDRELVRTVDQFVRKAGRYACNSRLTSRDRAELATMVRAPLALADDTEELLIAGRDAEDDTLSGDFTAVMDRLRARGYARYGCYSITHDNERLQRWYDGAEVMMLMFREDCGGGAAKAADALGLRIFFDDRKIARLVVTDKWVGDMLAINKSCALPRVVAAPAVTAANDNARSDAGQAGKAADDGAKVAGVARKTGRAEPAKGVAEGGAAPNGEASVDREIAAGDVASAEASAKAIGVPEITGSITPLVPADPVAAVNAIIDAASGM